MKKCTSKKSSLGTSDISQLYYIAGQYMAGCSKIFTADAEEGGLPYHSLRSNMVHALADTLMLSGMMRQMIVMAMTIKLFFSISREESISQ